MKVAASSEEAISASPAGGVEESTSSGTTFLLSFKDLWANKCRVYPPASTFRVILICQASHEPNF